MRFNDAKLSKLYFLDRNSSHYNHNNDLSVAWQSIFLIMYYTLSTFNLIGNCLISFVIIRNEKMHKVTNFFILNLAFADILNSLFVTPFLFDLNMTKESVWLSLICKLGPLFRSLNVTVSILTFTVLSVDRVYVIIFPLRKKMSKTLGVCIIGLIWMIGLIIGIYGFFSYELYLVDTTTIEHICSFVDNMPISIYLATILVFEYILPLLVLVTSYLFITRNHIRSNNSNANPDMMVNKSKKSFYNRKKVS
jgi:hypothetical protein